MSNSKNHHFVPQKFMSAWLPNDGQNVYALHHKKKGSEVFRPALKNICSSTHLNTIFTLDGPMNNENAITRVEANDMLLIDTLNKNDRGGIKYHLTKPDADKRILLIAVRMKLRTPKIINDFSSHIEKKMDPDLLSILRNKSKNTEEASLNASKIFYHTFLSNEKIRKELMLFFERFVIDVKILTSSQLLCGDDVCGSLNISNLMSNSLGAMPISPKRAIVFCRDREGLNFAMGLNDESFALWVNGLIRLHSDLVISNEATLCGTLKP